MDMIGQRLYTGRLPEGSCRSMGVYAIDNGIECGRRLRTFMIKEEEVQRNLVVAFHYRSCTNIWANIFLVSALLKSKNRSSVARTVATVFVCAVQDCDRRVHACLRALSLSICEELCGQQEVGCSTFFSKKHVFEVLKLL